MVLELEPHVFAVYAHLQPGSITVKVGDKVKVGQHLANLGNTGPSGGPHLHFGLLDQPNLFAGRSLPFVLRTLHARRRRELRDVDGRPPGDRAESKHVRRAYPLYGGIQNFPESAPAPTQR